MSEGVEGGAEMRAGCGGAGVFEVGGAEVLREVEGVVVAGVGELLELMQ